MLPHTAFVDFLAAIKEQPMLALVNVAFIASCYSTPRTCLFVLSKGMFRERLLQEEQLALQKGTNMLKYSALGFPVYLA